MDRSLTLIAAVVEVLTDAAFATHSYHSSADRYKM
jgi:hypothetical protein